jgi:hypothetical protein
MRSKDIVNLQQQSREAAMYWKELQKKFPVRSAGLRLVNNNTMREWSYKGVTLVSPPGGNNRKLTLVSRSDSRANSLPPTYREAPDFRDRRTRTASRNYHERFQEISDMHKRPWTSIPVIDKPITTTEILAPLLRDSSHKISLRKEDSSFGRIFDVSTMQGTHHLEAQSVHYSSADIYFRINVLHRE